MALRVEWKPTGDERTDNLGEQFVNRVGVFARGGPYRRRQEKFDQYRRFLVFVGGRFGSVELRNIQPRHIAAYIHHRRRATIKERTILKELAVIRWWHRQIPWHRYEIPDNATLFELEARLDDKEFCAEIKNRCRVRRRRRNF
jgi:hypothetical protein